ncbi:hypothetical protein [Lysobacter sp. D1-1-M9]|uniref:hypothetical protein n=1 Tax=Novilysobacter longmucuonensis TaxID=3098603 RepID=UPI002FCA238E
MLWQLAEALGVPVAYLLTDDELLARLLLPWNDLTIRQKKQVHKDVEAALAPPRSARE